MSWAIIKRDLMLGARSGGMWLFGILFFFVFLTLSAIALGGDPKTLAPLAPALLWLAVILSVMLSFGQIFHADYADGTIEHLLLSSETPISISASKTIVFALMALGPLFLMAPVAGMAFGLNAQTIAGFCLSLLFAAPALAVYGVMASAIMATRSGAGFLIVLMTAPFLVPVLIFGLAAVDSYTLYGLSAIEFRALLGLSLIACAIGLPAAGAALSTNLE